MNGTQQRNAAGGSSAHIAHLTLVPTPTVAELQQLVDLDRRPAPLRLTRRGRLVVVGMFLLALLGGGVLFGTGSKAGASDQAGTPHSWIVVQPGQTLWAIAKQVAPTDDPRATIEAIRRLNALPDTGIQAGQRIALP